VARPLQAEIDMLNPGSMLAGFLHLASARQDKIEGLLEKRITAIAFEQIQARDGSLPVLRPFSQIGGAMAAQIAARLLQNNWGGKGILMGGVPGVAPAEVVVLGAGTVGTYATQTFVGMGAHVTVLDHNLNALQRIWDRWPCIITQLSTRRNVERSVAYADVVVGAVLIPGQRSPVVVTREMVQSMKPRSVVMDISIDEGGCIETSRPTTHEHPVYIEEGILHYCVPNMTSIVARTAMASRASGEMARALSACAMAFCASPSSSASLARSSRASTSFGSAAQAFSASSTAFTSNPSEATKARPSSAPAFPGCSSSASSNSFAASALLKRSRNRRPHRTRSATFFGLRSTAVRNSLLASS
jgi:alanine dehydrogenase